MGVLAKKAETFLTEKVGSDGRTGSTYGEKVPRHDSVLPPQNSSRERSRRQVRRSSRPRLTRRG